MKLRIIGLLWAGVGPILVLYQAAFAGYQPPPQRSTPSTPTTTTGRRGGCDGESDYSLTILSPMNSIGRSTSLSPVVMWYVPDQQRRQMQLRLFEIMPNGTRQRLQNITLESQPGFMEYQLLGESIPLRPGQLYQWQVVLFCDRNQPSSAIVSTAMMKMMAVPNSSDRLDAMDKTPDTFQQLVQANRWYDAVLILSQFSDLQLKQQLQEELLKSVI